MSDSTYTIISRPVVTEKTNILREELNQYVFEVSRDANKVQIRRAVETIFGVSVSDVRTSIVRGKMKRLRKTIGKQSNWKRAIVTLREGESIELFEGV